MACAIFTYHSAQSGSEGPSTCKHKYIEKAHLINLVNEQRARHILALANIFALQLQNTSLTYLIAFDSTRPHITYKNIPLIHTRIQVFFLH